MHLLFMLVAVVVLSHVGDVYAADCIVNTSTPTYINGKRIDLQCNENGQLKTTGTGGGGGGDASAANQTTIIGHVDGVEGLLTTIDADTGNIAASTSTTATNTGTVAGAVDTTGTDRMRVTMYDSSGNEIVVPTAGLTANITSTASTNATSVKGSAGTLYGLSLTNITTTIYYLRLYNLASAPTCSSATGYVETIPIPPAAASGGAGGREVVYNIGKAFTTGIAYCLTGGPTSTDNTSAAVGIYGSGLYK